MSEQPTEYKAGKYGNDRSLIVTVFIYDHESMLDIDYGNVMSGLDCAFYHSCELIKRTFSIGTDAEASDSDCVDVFIGALKRSGVDVGRFEWREAQLV